jgi:hypothetical protein
MLIQTAPAGLDFPLVTLLTGFIALPVKFLVDMIKAAAPKLPDGYLPLIGVVFGFGFCMVVLVANRTAMDSAVYAQCGIAAIGAQAAAMTVTWNQNRAQKLNETIQAAIDAPSGTTVADVKAQVKGSGQ